MKHQWIYVYGRSPEITAAELAAVFRRDLGKVPDVVPAKEFMVADPVQPDPVAAIARLGGVVKIGEVLRTGSWSDQAALASVVAAVLTEQIKGPRKEFGLSCLPAQHVHRVNKLGLQVKRQLVAQGFPARFVTSDKQPLPSVVVQREGLLDSGAELLIARVGNDVAIARTVAVQPFASLSARDYGRPNRDALSGMLPPKLAIIMLNLSGLGPESVLLDPFCGSGTVLQEAELMGFRHLIGTDVNATAIGATRGNLKWLLDHTDIDPKQVTLQLKQTPFNDLPTVLGEKSADGIVTEPFLGPPLRRSTHPKVISDAVRDLSRLYNAFLATAKRLLRQGGMLVVVVPKLRVGKQTFRDLLLAYDGFKTVEVLPSGWGIRTRSLVYGRPDQHIYRKILVLRRS